MYVEESQEWGRKSWVHSLCECRVKTKTIIIQGDSSHILASIYLLLPPGNRFRLTKLSVGRAKKLTAFVHNSVEQSLARPVCTENFY